MNYDKQTEALKLALEALIAAFQGKDKTGQVTDAINAIRKALAEQPAQQQEPVAWRHDMGEENGGWEYFEEASCPECQPLYTSPPVSKPWQGLTDRERLDAERLSDQQYAHTRGQELRPSWASLFCRAIEAKLREKNA